MAGPMPTSGGVKAYGKLCQNFGWDKPGYKLGQAFDCARTYVSLGLGLTVRGVEASGQVHLHLRDVLMVPLFPI